MQVCHGQAAPLRRNRPGDGVVYYSPTLASGDRAPFRALTAIGAAAEGEPHPFDTGGGFRPWRRDVAWRAASEVPIAPLLPRLGFSAGKRDRGRQLRFGLLASDPEDFDLMAAAMHGAG